MKRSMLLAAALAWCLGASAARAEPPPIFNWTGFYVGVNGGGINYNTEGRFLNGSGWRTEDIDVGLGGVHAGYQVQTGNFVWGVEVAWDGLLSNRFSSRFGPNLASQCGLPGAYCQAQIKEYFSGRPARRFRIGTMDALRDRRLRSHANRISFAGTRQPTGRSFGRAS